MLIITYTIINNKNIIRDKKYQSYLVNSLISKLDKEIINKELKIKSLNYLLIKIIKL